MARILGVQIPDNKRVIIGLTYIYGVGRHIASVILQTIQIDPNTRIVNLTPEQFTRIAKEIDTNYKVEGTLRAEKAVAIKNLKDIDCYRGWRHKRGLPVRGQKTRNNCRAHKGKKANSIKKKKR